MTRFLVMADSHGDWAAFERCLAAEPNVDSLIFLGDGLDEAESAVEALAAGGRHLYAYMVRGNCDYGSPYPAEGLIASEGFAIFYTHGHLYNVRPSTDELRRTARRRGADIALYGHTHCADIDEKPGWPAVYNPGSISRPRNAEGPTYGILELERGEKPRFTLHPVPPPEP